MKSLVVGGRCLLNVFLVKLRSCVMKWCRLVSMWVLILVNFVVLFNRFRRVKKKCVRLRKKWLR